MRTIKLFIAVAAGAALWSCNVKDPIYDTPHPDHGQLTVVTDWSETGEGAVRPASWLAVYGDQRITVTADTYTFPELLDPGNYTINFFNEPDQIAIVNNTATVSGSDGNVSSLPGWLFSGVLEAVIERDTDYEFTVVMHQQVRQLTLIIEPTGGSTGRIEEIDATLSGVAASLDLTSGTHGTPASVELNFTEITSGTDAGKWSATVRLLGVTGAVQSLSGTITFDGGTPAPVTLQSDLSAGLLNFNDDKPTPLTLSGTVVETPTSAGISATIINWLPGQDQSGIAN